MTGNKTAIAERKDSQLQKGLMWVSVAWIGGVGAIGYLTVPGSTASPVYLPASIETAETGDASSVTQITAESRVDFIVRFKDVEAVKMCLEMFKEDPDGARNVFAGWAGDYDALSGMSLKKTSYAGELILTWLREDGQRPNRADIIAKQQELQSMPVVEYADPDYTAHAGDTPQ